MRGAFAVFVLIAHLGCGCAAQPFVRSDRVAAQHAYSKKTYALARSLYLSQLYDDNERWMLSERPSHEVSHRVSLFGHPIHPPSEIGIVPAGTEVTLERVEFPTRSVVAHRMLNSPVHHIWLRLRPSPQALLPVAEARPCVVVLGLEVETTEALHAAIDAQLQDPGETNRWLRSLSPSVRVGVLSKRVVIGMDLRALRAAVGDPLELRPAGTSDEPNARMARYKGFDAWIVDEKVTEVRHK